MFNIFTDKVALEVINEWNRDNAFSRASLGADNNLYLETEIPVRGGVTRENIELQVKGFRDSIAKWARVILEYKEKHPVAEPERPARPATTTADTAPVPLKSYTKTSAAKKRVKTTAGDFGIWLDEAKWKDDPSAGPNALQYLHANGELWAKVITERLGIPTEGLREIALINAKKVAPDAKIELEEYRMVNGKRVLALQISGATKGIPFRFFGYYHGGTSGTVQAVTWTVESAFKEHQEESAAFLNGLEINDDELPSTNNPPAPSPGLLQLNSPMRIKYDPAKWKQTRNDRAGRFSFAHTSGDGYALVITERLSVPLDSLPEIALSNAKSADPNATITFKEKRTVNGAEVWFLKMDAEVNKIPLSYYGYYFGGKAGTVQVITYAGKSLAAEYEKDFMGFLEGLSVVE